LALRVPSERRTHLPVAITVIRELARSATRVVLRVLMDEHQALGHVEALVESVDARSSPIQLETMSRIFSLVPGRIDMPLGSTEVSDFIGSTLPSHQKYEYL